MNPVLFLLPAVIVLLLAMPLIPVYRSVTHGGEAAGKKANVLCQFDVTLTENENTQTLEMCDYGTAADNFSNIDQKFFNLYL